ncbi:type IV secretion system protein (plasmid) [Xanthomonas campestris pv. campestris]|nr:type IV secretion system protein [Xanthomonas campestris pv. campestris]
MPNIPAQEAPMIFRFVGDSLSNLAEGYIGEASSNVIAMLGPIALAGVTLFITIYGYMVIFGKITSPINDLVIKILKMAFVSAIALNAGNYMDMVRAPIDGLETGLVQALSTGGSGATSTYEALDQGIGKANALVLYCWAKSATYSLLTDPGGYISWWSAGSLIAAGIVAFFFVGGAFVVAAKFSLALLFGIGPFFVLGLMWPVTAQFFDRWLSSVLSKVFSVALLSGTFGLGLQIFNQLIGATSANEWGSPAFMALQILGIFIVLGVVLYMVNQEAAGLGGGVAASAIRLGQLAGLLTAPASAATSGARMLNPVSNRLDPNTGLQTQSSRLEHMAMGRSFVAKNPAYRRAVMDQFRSAMGRGNAVKGK